MPETKSSSESSPSRGMSLSTVSLTSYVAVMVLLGLPMWWKTTEVYRVSLPYDDIDDLDDLKTVLRAQVQLVTSEEMKFGPKLQASLVDSDVYSFYLTIRQPSDGEAKAAASAKSLSQLDAALAPLHSNMLLGKIILFQASDALLSGPKSVVVGNHRSVFFGSQADPSALAAVVREVVLGESAVAKTLSSIEVPSHRREQDEDDKAAGAGDRGVLRRVPASTGYDVLFSLLVPEPDKVLVTWNDAAATVEDYVGPFVRGLGNFSEISVKTQVLYLQKLNLKAKKKKVGGVDVNAVTQKDLGLAINPVESQLASHVSSKPRLNFLVYVPTVEQTPLHITTDDSGSTELLESNSFLIPRWGGVMVHNVEEAAQLYRAQRQKFDSVQTAVDTDRVVGTFVAQMRLLLGLQDYSRLDQVKTGHVDVRPLSLSRGGGGVDGTTPLRDWERDFLYRLRTVENLHLARATLQSLAHLLSQISNIVIEDDIGEQVHQSVRACQAASSHLQKGLLAEAFESSKEAFVSSETAFFDPSLLALLYFPEDQKYAIYIPLFLPVGIPVLLPILYYAMELVGWSIL